MSTSLTASARAMLLPEVVACIADCLLEPDYECDGSIFAHYLNCMVLNRLWFQETARALWYCPHDDLRCDRFAKHLPDILARSERPQFYADMIHEAHMSSGLSESDTSLLRQLRFPKLRVLNVTMLSKLLPEFALIKDNLELDILRMDPPTGSYPQSYWFSEDQFEEILGEVAELFPNLKELEFMDTFLAHPGWEARLSQRMPRLIWSGDHPHEAESP